MANQSAQKFLADNLQPKVKTENVGLINAPPTVPGILPDNSTVVKDWHQSVTQDLRQQLIWKIVEVMIPSPITHISSSRLKTISTLNLIAQKFEGGIYSAANSRAEYYQLLSEKIFKIQKNLQESRQKREEMRMQHQSVGGLNSSPMASYNAAASPELPVTSAATSLNVTLNQCQFSLPRVWQCPLATIANQHVDTSAVSTSGGIISVSQFNSSLQQAQPQMMDAFKNLQVTDFGSFVKSFQKGHQHKMEKPGFGLNEDSGSGNQKQTDPRIASFQRCIKYLVHACKCRGENCRLPGCIKMKGALRHVKKCKQKASRGCQDCLRFVEFCCYHARRCQEAKCKVPFCPEIRYKLKEHEVEELEREVASLKTCAQQFQQRARDMITMTNRGLIQQSPGNSNSDADDTELMTLNQKMQSLKLKPMSRVQNRLSNMKNVGSCKNLRYPQNQQPNEDTKPLPDLQLFQSSQIMERANGGRSDSIENSAMGPSQVMSDPGPSTADMQRPTNSYQQFYEALMSPAELPEQLDIDKYVVNL